MRDTAVGNATLADKTKRNSELARRLVKNRALYLMIVPGFLFFVIFKYIPMGGLVIALQDYQPYLGISDSPWVGFKHFERLFSEPMFFTILRNTLLLFFLNLL
ncbi:MAG TPA: sugar ABC transporter permease, partial [Paenibacillus sp.]|nr:sugar ABC transporter permease [Paenibacillus sp.]